MRAGRALASARPDGETTASVLMQVDRSQASLYLALLLQQMVMNMSESEWFSRGSTFAVLILASICLSRGLLEVRPRVQPVRSAGR